MDEYAATEAFDLSGFRALRLADSHVGDPAARRVLSRPYPGVPDRIRDWQRKGRLTHDPEPALYVHEYTSHGVTVRGVVGTVDLVSGENRIHPHEAVHEIQVTQLIDRMRTMSVNPAPLLLMHSGPTSVRSAISYATSQPPDFIYTDRGDQLHRLWQITDERLTSSIAQGLQDAHVVIADGHHRYAAARALQAEHPGTEWDRTLVMVIDQADTPLQLGAVHRTIARLSMETVAKSADALDAIWETPPTSHRALAHLDRALVLHDGETWGVLRPRTDQGLLVSWLHERLLPAWGVEDDRIRHHHSATEAMARASIALAVLLPAPSFADVAASARSGHLLPQKASSFQPKPHSGVLMRMVNGEADDPTAP